MKGITLTPLNKVDRNGFLASYLAERSQQEPEIIKPVSYTHLTLPTNSRV